MLSAGTNVSLVPKQASTMRPGPALMAAGGRTCCADIGHNHAGKACREEARANQIGLQPGFRGHPVGSNSLPKWIALHSLSGEVDIAPSLSTLEVVGALNGEGSRTLRGFGLRGTAMGRFNQLAARFSGPNSA